MQESIAVDDFMWIAKLLQIRIRLTLSSAVLKSIPLSLVLYMPDSIYGAEGPLVHLYMVWGQDGAAHNYGHFNLLVPDPVGSLMLPESAPDYDAGQTQTQTNNQSSKTNRQTNKQPIQQTNNQPTNQTNKQTNNLTRHTLVIYI
jgi:hypothetical protein